MAQIEVEKLKEGEFQVRITEKSGESTHRVTLTEDAYRRLSGGKVNPQEVIKRSFEFLLEREPKESILPKFDLQLIGHYFPEYEGELKRRI